MNEKEQLEQELADTKAKIKMKESDIEDRKRKTVNDSILIKSYQKHILVLENAIASCK